MGLKYSIPYNNQYNYPICKPHVYQMIPKDDLMNGYFGHLIKMRELYDKEEKDKDNRTEERNSKEINILIKEIKNQKEEIRFLKEKIIKLEKIYNFSPVNMYTQEDERENENEHDEKYQKTSI